MREVRLKAKNVDGRDKKMKRSSRRRMKVCIKGEKGDEKLKRMTIIKREKGGG
jgi:hypothetical protein